MENVHTFHIPVLGIGFSVDTPIKVARYGISSVISLVNDGLIENARMVHSREYGEPYEPIDKKDEDPRARRITSYMNLMGRIVKRQVEELQASPFEEGSEITRYYGMLPDSGLKNKYQAMLAEKDPVTKEQMQTELRTLAVPGSIDANIMTKLDVDKYSMGEKKPPEYSDALSAFRGFANSDLDHSSMILSAGLNPRLYGYIGKFEDFKPDDNGNFKKKIVLKVSDYRSAEVQGKFLATRGVWVSEYRIESGLNCGGHAFPTHGLLMGPILETFMNKRHELEEKISASYMKTLEKEGRVCDFELAPIRITVQGGIGTAEEDRFLRKYYNMDGTGWGSPFLLVPEVTNIDG
ncbi:MAG: hypothetical protein JW738_09100, partial [Actinobacteria bacterium]|nr:hypothetical protein [Actinomycetota bacterium]